MQRDANVFLTMILFPLGFPGGSDSKEFTCNAGDLGSYPGLGRSPTEGDLPTPVFLLGEFHGQRNLVVYSPWSCKELDMTERLTFCFHRPCQLCEKSKS